MDLDGDGAFNAIWQHFQPRCEALAGAPLRVIRQYANGHTYGLGGNPHADDNKPGSFTLLYYPNPEWQDDWDGETVFYDGSGEIAFAVRPRPNRAVFFDSRIVHAGRAPSRICPGLRVTVAYKLEIATGPLARVRTQEPAANSSQGPAGLQEAAAPKEVPGAVTKAVTEVEEIGRDGAARIYRAQVGHTAIERAMEERLNRLAESVRLPGFRPGKIPRAVLEQRYAAQARAGALKQLAADLVEHALPAGSVCGSCELAAGAESGDMELRIHATHLPDLPSLDFSQLAIQRLTPAESGDPSPEAAAFIRNHLKSQVLDRLDSGYSLPLFPGMIEREFTAIWKALESQTGIPSEAGDRTALAAEFRAIAERRLRLGMVVAEMARRFEIRAAHGAELEDKVIDYLIAQAPVEQQQVTAEELCDLMKG
jgi:hypothetical protein